jgi:hypothetical protein
MSCLSFLKEAVPVVVVDAGKKQPKDETKAEEAKDKEASMPELDSKEEPASGPPRGAEGEKGDVEEDT